MPNNMSGIELTRQIMGECKVMKVLLTAGYPAHLPETEEDAIQAGSQAVLKDATGAFHRRPRSIHERGRRRL